MASLETVATDLLKAFIGDADIGALIGDRAYLGLAPQPTEQDYLILSTIGNEKIVCHDGDANLDTTRFQFDIVSKSLHAAMKIGTQIKNFLSGKKLSLPNSEIQAALMGTEYDQRDQRAERWAWVMDFLITYDSTDNG